MNKRTKRSCDFFFANRGLVLDVFVFLLNIVLMRTLVGNFIDLIGHASNGDTIAGYALFLFFVALFVLPPTGATLKRWHFHQRIKKQGKTAAKPEAFMAGCLFNPIMFFCLNIFIVAGINAFLMQFIYENKEPDGAVFVSSMLFGMLAAIAQTFLVYRYFSEPKKEPPTAFLKGRNSETLGDLCLFLNMIFFQILWNLAMTSIPPRPTGVSIFAELGFRFFFIGFASLLVYFPPRIFYLAEDISKRRTWLTILLANSPLILRMLYDAI